MNLSGASFPCRLCGSGDLNLSYTQGNAGEFRFYRCARCRLVNYDLEGGLSQQKYATSFPDPLDDSLRTNRTQTRSYEFLRRHVPIPGRMLDIGCGNGRLLYLARRDGCAVRGLEISEYLAEQIRARLGIEVLAADFLDLEEDRGAFDIVVMRHVLEHLPDSLGALRKVRQLLAPRGHAVLEFPNIDALDLKLKRFLHRAGLSRRRYAADYQPGHCNEFCRESFRYLAEQTGFDIVLWETYSQRAVSNFVFNRVKVGSKARTVIRKADETATFPFSR